MMLLAIAGFTGFYATLASLPAHVVATGGSTASAGATTTVMLAATVLFQPAVPAMLRRLPTRATLVLGLAALGLPAPLLIWSDSGAGLYCICAMRGVGFAIFTVASALMTSEVAPPGRQGETAGLYGLAAAIPNVTVLPLAVLLTHAVGFWLIASIASLPVLGIVFALGGGWRRPAGPEPTETRTRRATRAAIARSLLPAAVLCAITVAGGAVVTILPILRPGFVATAGLLVFATGGALARWRAGVHADRHGPSWLLPGACAIAIAGLLGLPWGLDGRVDLVVLMACALLGAGYGAVQSLTLVDAFARAAPRERPIASAVWNGAFDAGTAVGATLIGLLSAAGTGLWGAFAVLAAIVAAVVPAAMSLSQPSR